MQKKNKLYELEMDIWHELASYKTWPHICCFHLKRILRWVEDVDWMSIEAGGFLQIQRLNTETVPYLIHYFQYRLYRYVACDFCSVVSSNLRYPFHFSYTWLSSTSDVTGVATHSGGVLILSSLLVPVNSWRNDARQATTTA